jgi:hypothetical protein
VGLERGSLSLVRIYERLLEGKVAAPVKKPDINGSGESPRSPRDTPLSAKVGTKIRRPSAVDKSV